MRLAVLQHTEAEGPGSIAAWAGQRGVRLRLYPLHSGVEAPTLEAFDLLAIMGGSMSVHDAGSLPWMPAEKMLIRQALAAGKPLLGICLGAQLLAEALGASVSAGTAEIGWWPIQRHPRALRSPLAAGLPATLTPLHWHGETFSLPNDAIHLYSSATCANQGFVWRERAIGLQCHLEATAQTLEGMLDTFPHDLQLPGEVQDAAQLRAGLEHCRDLQPVLFDALDYLARAATPQAR
jgi:GMP synthase-like glutamine amidotransferase